MPAQNTVDRDSYGNGAYGDVLDSPAYRLAQKYELELLAIPVPGTSYHSICAMLRPAAPRQLLCGLRQPQIVL